MLIKIFLNYIFGYINIIVEGFFTERFINICNNNKILLWNIKRKNSSIICCNISISDYRKLRKICNKLKCRIKINKKKGLPFIFNKYKKRKIFILFLILILFIIFISSRYVWNIEISGTEKIDKNELLFQIQENGLEIGKLKSKINTKDIITNIRLQRNDISWMEINLNGTNAIVSVIEAKEKPNIINDNEYCDIVSDKKGIIEKITAERGTALVKTGDIVDVGTKLIGGYMEGKYTDLRYVHAKGEIKAKTWYTIRKKSKFTREEMVETGNKKNRYSIFFNNFKINLYKSIPKFEKYDTINENKKIRLFSNFYLPISIQKDTYLELITNKVAYGKVELQNLLISEIEEEFENCNIDEQNIKNKIVNVYDINEDEIEIEVTYEISENIGIENPLIEK